MIKNINIVVIGCGYWGKNLIRNFYKLGVLYGINDKSQNLTNFFAKKYKVKSIELKDIIKDKSIHGVVIATPPKTHFQFLVKLLPTKKFIFVEKPMLNSLQEVKILKNKYKNFTRKIFVGHLLHYHPIVKKIKKILKNDEILNISSERKNFGKVRSHEDVIWSFAPHDISMILSLSDHKPIEVTTNCSYLLQKSIADKAIIGINFDSGLRAHINLSWLNPYKEQKIVIIGSLGSLIFDDTLSWDKKLAIYPHQIDLSNELPDLNQSKPTYIELDESEPLRNECNHFLDVVNHGLKPLTDGEEGFSVLKILTAAKLSQTNSKSVKI